MSDYTFPFDTCEKPNKKGIAQPYSALVNIINCIIILYFLSKTKNDYTKILLFFILCFELFHVFSHTIHIQGSSQIKIIHFLAYCINFSLLYFFYKYTKHKPENWFIILYILLILFDLYAFTNLNVVYFIITSALLFVFVLFYYYSLLTGQIKNKINIIFLLVIIAVCLILNEKYNCKKMIAINPNFPYHIFIEIIGIFLFYVICSTFYEL